MSKRTIIHKRINLPAVITITLPDFIDLEPLPNDDSDNDDDDNFSADDIIDMIKLLDDIIHIQESQQGDYQFILSKDIPQKYKNDAREYLLENEWIPDKHLPNDDGKKILRGYKKLL